MREVKVVKQKRDFLRNVRAKAFNTRTEIMNERNFSELDEYEKNVVLEIWKGIEKLDAQIEALTFVLNEDSEMSQSWVRVGRGLTAFDLMGSKNWYDDEPKYN